MANAVRSTEAANLIYELFALELGGVAVILVVGFFLYWLISKDITKLEKSIGKDLASVNARLDKIDEQIEKSGEKHEALAREVSKLEGKIEVLDIIPGSGIPNYGIGSAFRERQRREPQ